MYKRPCPAYECENGAVDSGGSTPWGEWINLPCGCCEGKGYIEMEYTPITYLLWHMAAWFSENEPGTPVPEWCELSWPIERMDVDELVRLYEEDTGQLVHEFPKVEDEST